MVIFAGVLVGLGQCTYKQVLILVRYTCYVNCRTYGKAQLEQGQKLKGDFVPESPSVCVEG